MMSFPLDGLLDEQACHDFLLQLLHPTGLCCPNGHGPNRYGVHMAYRKPILEYQCRECGKFFCLFTGTVLTGTHFRCSQVVQILRGIVQATPTAQMAREMGLSRRNLMDWRHLLQGLAEQARHHRPDDPLPDAAVETDECYVNAGEKRPAA